LTVQASLVIQTAFLGDVVLTTPLIAVLATRGPVDVVTTPAAAGLLANNPHIREVIPYDKGGADGGLFSFLRMARRLRRAKYGVAYIAQASLRSGALAAAAGIPTRTGFATASGRAFYTQRIAIPEGLHASARLLRLANGDPADNRVSLFPGISERAAVDRLLALHESHNDAPLVALAPASIWATKRWPYYPDLARLLAANARVVVLGSAEDAPLAREVCKAAGASAINAAGALSLLGSAELVRRCRVLVTNDSAPQHLASAVGTPTVTLFGPTVAEFGFGPLAPASESVGIDGLSCRPCHPHGPKRCPEGHWRCMLELAPERVAARVEHILSQSAS
jgi:heptosyltransferase-2